MTLQCVPAFTLHHVERPHPVDEVLADLGRYVDTNEHFEFYWLPHTDRASTIENNRTDEAPDRDDEKALARLDILYPNYFFGTLVGVGRLRPSLVPRSGPTVAGGAGSTELVDRSDRILIATGWSGSRKEYCVPRPRPRAPCRASTTSSTGWGCA